MYVNRRLEFSTSARENEDSTVSLTMDKISKRNGRVNSLQALQTSDNDILMRFVVERLGSEKGHPCLVKNGRLATDGP